MACNSSLHRAQKRSECGNSLGNGTPTLAVGSSAAFIAQFVPLTTNTLSLTAKYSGDTIYHSASAGTPVQVTVRKATPTLQFDSPPATFVCGSPTSFTADLAFPPLLGLFNRSVTLFGQSAGSVAIFTVTAQGSLALSALAAGRATAPLSATLSKTTNSVSLSFSGDQLYNPANTALPIHVQPVPVSVQLFSSAAEGGVRLSAAVNPTSSCGGPGPTGNVTFLEGSTVLAVLPLPGIVASPILDGTSNTIVLGEQNAVSTLVARPAGPHTFTAKYAGDQFHQAGVSTPITVTFQ